MCCKGRWMLNLTVLALQCIIKSIWELSPEVINADIHSLKTHVHVWYFTTLLVSNGLSSLISTTTGSDARIINSYHYNRNPERLSLFQVARDRSMDRFWARSVTRGKHTGLGLGQRTHAHMHVHMYIYLLLVLNMLQSLTSQRFTVIYVRAYK